MSGSLYLYTEYAQRRAEVEADDGTLWIRVDDDVVAWTPSRFAEIAAMRAALDTIEAGLVETQEAA